MNKLEKAEIVNGEPQSKKPVINLDILSAPSNGLKLQTCSRRFTPNLKQ